MSMCVYACVSRSPVHCYSRSLLSCLFHATYIDHDDARPSPSHHQQRPNISLQLAHPQIGLGRSGGVVGGEGDDGSSVQ